MATVCLAPAGPTIEGAAARPARPAPSAPRIWTAVAVPIIAFAMTVATTAATVAAATVWRLAQGTPRETLVTDLREVLATPGGVIALGLAVQMAFLATAVLAARLSPEPTARRLGLVRPRLSVTTYVALAFATWLPLAAGQGLIAVVTPWFGPVPSPEALFSRMTPGWAACFLLFISLAPGFCEEVLFRGYLQRRLLQRWPRGAAAWAAVGFTSILFALVHMNPYSIIAVLPFGLWVGWVGWRTGSIWPGFVCHVFLNATWTARHLGVHLADWPEALPPLALAAAGTLAVAGFLYSIRTLKPVVVPARQD